MLDTNKDGTIDKVELIFSLKNMEAFTNTQVVNMTNFLLPDESNSSENMKALLTKLLEDYNNLTNENMEDLQHRKLSFPAKHLR